MFDSSRSNQKPQKDHITEINPFLLINFKLPSKISTINCTMDNGQYVIWKRTVYQSTVDLRHEDLTGLYRIYCMSKKPGKFL